MIRRALGLLLALAGCESSHADPGDLLGVFDSAAPSSSASAAPLLKVATSASAAAASEGPPLAARERAPIAGPCVAPSGEPARLYKRPARRPACRRSRIIEDRDPDGTPRYACIFAPSDLDDRKPLPLIVFLHGEFDDPRAVHQKTRLQSRQRSFDLSGDPNHMGFVVMAPQARHILLGSANITDVERWDIDHVARDNADAAAIDRFVDELVEEGAVDARQIYAVGDGRGGSMAQLYAMLRPDRIAAVGIYAAAPRFAWTCDGPPPPVGVIYRSCDTVLPCADVEQWLRAREELHLPTFSLRLGAGKASEPSCSLDAGRCREKYGIANHQRWPKPREGELLEYLGRFSVRASP